MHGNLSLGAGRWDSSFLFHSHALPLQGAVEPMQIDVDPQEDQQNAPDINYVVENPTLVCACGQKWQNGLLRIVFLNLGSPSVLTLSKWYLFIVLLVTFAYILRKIDLYCRLKWQARGSWITTARKSFTLCNKNSPQLSSSSVDKVLLEWSSTIGDLLKIPVLL